MRAPRPLYSSGAECSWPRGWRSLMDLRASGEGEAEARWGVSTWSPSVGPTSTGLSLRGPGERAREGSRGARVRRRLGGRVQRDRPGTEEPVPRSDVAADGAVVSDDAGGLDATMNFGEDSPSANMEDAGFDAGRAGRRRTPPWASSSTAAAGKTRLCAARSPPRVPRFSRGFCAPKRRRKRSSTSPADVLRTCQSGAGDHDRGGLSGIR